MRVGCCAPFPRAGRSATGFLLGFDARMRELGYVEGQNFTMDYIDLQGRIDRYVEATQQLVDRKADVIVAFGPEESLKAALAVTRTIPIVIVAIDYDPIALGYVTSLARPTGNVTGLFLEQIELAAKRLQLVKDAFPAVGKARATTRPNSASISLVSSCAITPMITRGRLRRRRRNIVAFSLP